MAYKSFSFYSSYEEYSKDITNKLRKVYKGDISSKKEVYTMAVDTKDKVYGCVIVAILAGSALHWYGTQFYKTTGSENADIAGETVEIVNYENRLWGGGKYIRLDGEQFTVDGYKDRLESLVDKALEEKK